MLSAVRCIKSEVSILLEETVIRSHYVFKVICRALRIVGEKFYYVGIAS